MANSTELFDSDLIYSQHGLANAPLWCRLTSGFRIKPKVFIIGAQKAGTTSLSEYLSGLPEVIPSKQKEISFFNNDTRFNLGEKWYASFFATSFIKKQRDKQINVDSFTYDATANYFEEIRSAKRIKNFDPKAKVIVILRNPVYRAWSHYKMAVKYGFETKTFKEALELEDARIKSNTKEHNFALQRLGYRAKGEYINFLPEWKETFGENFHLVFYEHLFSENETSLKKIHEFLKLNSKPDLSKLKHMNKGNDGVLDLENEINLKKHYASFNKKLAEYLKQELPW